jgi:hypothetical protein
MTLFETEHDSYTWLNNTVTDALVDHLQHDGGRAQISVHGLLPQRRLESVETVQLHLPKVVNCGDLPFTERLVNRPVS